MRKSVSPCAVPICWLNKESRAAFIVPIKNLGFQRIWPRYDRVVEVEKQLSGYLRCNTSRNLVPLGFWIRPKKFKLAPYRAVARHRLKPGLAIMTFQRKEKRIPDQLPNAQCFNVVGPEGFVSSPIRRDASVKEQPVGSWRASCFILIASIISVEFG